MSEPSREEAEANDIIVAYFDSRGINNARAGAFNILDRLKDGGLTVRRAAKPERERVIDPIDNAEAAFEFIRLKLIDCLEEPQRSAFWKAVEARDYIRALKGTPA